MSRDCRNEQAPRTESRVRGFSLAIANQSARYGVASPVTRSR
jgi:hypothetical protein